MARVKGGVNAKKRHKKILKAAKGFYLSRHTTFKAAKAAKQAAEEAARAASAADASKESEE